MIHLLRLVMLSRKACPGPVSGTRGPQQTTGVAKRPRSDGACAGAPRTARPIRAGSHGVHVHVHVHALSGPLARQSRAVPPRAG